MCLRTIDSDLYCNYCFLEIIRPSSKKIGIVKFSRPENKKEAIHNRPPLINSKLLILNKLCYFIRATEVLCS